MLKYQEMIAMIDEFSQEDITKKMNFLEISNSLSFREYLMPDFNVAFKIAEYYELNTDLVQRTLDGEETILINANEILCNKSKDIVEYNRIVLMKRMSYVFNFIAAFVIVVTQDQKLFNQFDMHVEENQGIIVAKEFVDQYGQYRDDIYVSVFFDGEKVHCGSWKLSVLVEQQRNNDRILYVPSESVYPLNLCTEYFHQIEIVQLSRSQEDIMSRYFSGLNLDGKVMKMALFDAVPGSGKTTLMKKRIEEKGKEKSLVLVPTRIEAEELKDEGYFAFTVDSIHRHLVSMKQTYNIHGQLRNINYIFVDECFMIHSGQLRWIVEKMVEIGTIMEVNLFGDRGQIPYYARVNYRCEYAREVQNMVRDVYKMNYTYRCPQKMEGFLKVIYDRNVQMKSRCEGEIVVKLAMFKEMISILKVPYDETVILTFTQSEAQELRNQGIQCQTVGESQGQTYENVILVRVNQYSRMIYSKKEHLTVALTRHRNSIKYITPVEDFCYELLSKINLSEEIEMKENKMELGIYEIEIKQKDEVRESNWEERKKERMLHSSNYENKQVGTRLLDREIIRRCAQKKSDSWVSEIVFSFKKIACEYDPNVMDRFAYSWRIRELQEDLRMNKVKFDNQKFEKKLSQEFVSYAERDKIKIGKFVANAPKARIDKVDLLHVLYSVKKRNADVSEIRDFLMTLEPNYVVGRFFECFVDDKRWNEQDKYFEEFRVDFIEKWKKTRTVQQLNKLHYEHQHIIEIDYTEYNSFVKTIVKNKLDVEAYDQEQAAQIVAGAHAIMVEYFTPMVKQFSLLLQSVLKDNYLINDGINNEYLQWFVNDRCKGGVKKIVPLEMDYSKFDKNQDWIDLYYQMLIMKRFGIPEWLCDQWVVIHLITKLRFTQYGISMETFMQRKSGDAFTFMGNTLFTMIMYSCFYGEMECLCGLFGGDDSLIMYEENQIDMINDYGEEIAAAFNMEIKYLSTKLSVVFASKFFVFADDYIYVLPDLMKQVIRYNRVLKTQEHALAQQMSSRILNQQIYDLNYQTLMKYFDCMYHRYGINSDLIETWNIILVKYLYLLESGMTWKLYKDYYLLRHADRSEMEKLHLRLMKKISFEEIGRYRPTKNEKQFYYDIQQKTTVMIIEPDGHAMSDRVNINSLNCNNYNKLRELIGAEVMSYLDRNGYVRGNILQNKKIDKEEKLFVQGWVSWIKGFVFKVRKCELKLRIQSHSDLRLDKIYLCQVVNEFISVINQNTGVIFSIVVDFE